MNTNDKILQLRQLLFKNNLDAYIISTIDPHISEYPPEHYKSREWISGFSGSVGTFVITKTNSFLWVDGRYFIQAEAQIKNTEINLMKIGESDVLDIPEFLLKNLNEKSIVGFDAKVFQTKEALNLSKVLSKKKITINSDLDLISDLWENRPNLSNAEIFIHPIEFAGKSRVEKIMEIREELIEIGADYNVILTLDDIAWILNIRGRDVDYNPVALSYLIIGKDFVKLFINDIKLNPEVRKELENDGIDISEYRNFYSFLESEFKDDNILLDFNKSNYLVYRILENNNLINHTNPSTKFKAIKNKVEIDGMRQSMIRDGVALAKFQFWLESNYNNNYDEVYINTKLNSFRSESDLFFGDSFHTIAGFGSNGAIIHYGASEASAATIKDDNLFLLDSGGQYYDGTTDITRVFHLGEPNNEQKEDYTNVLKGHIRLNKQKFPASTRGSQLDILARMDLWNRFENYKHGTGHGVGAFLNVHEGPQNIRTEENSTILVEGMILSNEPGLYRKDKWGIRFENLILVKNATSNEFGDFLEFEVLTIYPVETKLLSINLLTEAEIEWINNYNRWTYDMLSPLLDENHRNWLMNKTKEVK